MEITNIDALVDDKKKYIAINPYAPKTIFRMLVSGGSGSGKTNMVAQMILKYLHFDKEGF